MWSWYCHMHSIAHPLPSSIIAKPLPLTSSVRRVELPIRGHTLHYTGSHLPSNAIMTLWCNIRFILQFFTLLHHTEWNESNHNIVFQVTATAIANTALLSLLLMIIIRSIMMMITSGWYGILMLRRFGEGIMWIAAIWSLSILNLFPDQLNWRDVVDGYMLFQRSVAQGVYSCTQTRW